MSKISASPLSSPKGSEVSFMIEVSNQADHSAVPPVMTRRSAASNSYVQSQIEALNKMDLEAKQTSFKLIREQLQSMCEDHNDVVKEMVRLERQSVTEIKKIQNQLNLHTNDFIAEQRVRTAVTERLDTDIKRLRQEFDNGSKQLVPTITEVVRDMLSPIQSTVDALGHGQAGFKIQLAKFNDLGATTSDVPRRLDRLQETIANEVRDRTAAEQSLKSMISSHRDATSKELRDQTFEHSKVVRELREVFDKYKDSLGPTLEELRVDMQFVKRDVKPYIAQWSELEAKLKTIEDSVDGQMKEHKRALDRFASDLVELPTQTLSRFENDRKERDAAIDAVEEKVARMKKEMRQRELEEDEAIRNLRSAVEKQRFDCEPLLDELRNKIRLTDRDLKADVAQLPEIRTKLQDFGDALESGLREHGRILAVLQSNVQDVKGLEPWMADLTRKVEEGCVARKVLEESLMQQFSDHTRRFEDMVSGLKASKDAELAEMEKELDRKKSRAEMEQLMKDLEDGLNMRLRDQSEALSSLEDTIRRVLEPQMVDFTLKVQEECAARSTFELNLIKQLGETKKNFEFLVCDTITKPQKEMMAEMEKELAMSTRRTEAVQMVKDLRKEIEQKMAHALKELDDRFNQLRPCDYQNVMKLEARVNELQDEFKHHSLEWTKLRHKINAFDETVLELSFEKVTSDNLRFHDEFRKRLDELQLQVAHVKRGVFGSGPGLTSIPPSGDLHVEMHALEDLCNNPVTTRLQEQKLALEKLVADRAEEQSEWKQTVSDVQLKVTQLTGALLGNGVEQPNISRPVRPQGPSQSLEEAFNNPVYVQLQEQKLALEKVALAHADAVGDLQCELMKRLDDMQSEIAHLICAILGRVPEQNGMPTQGKLQDQIRALEEASNDPLSAQVQKQRLALDKIIADNAVARDETMRLLAELQTKIQDSSANAASKLPESADIVVEAALSRKVLEQLQVLEAACANSAERCASLENYVAMAPDPRPGITAHSITSLEDRVEETHTKVSSLCDEVKPISCKLKAFEDILASVQEQKVALDKMAALLVHKQDEMEQNLAKLQSNSTNLQSGSPPDDHCTVSESLPHRLQQHVQVLEEACADAANVLGCLTKQQLERCDLTRESESSCRIPQSNKDTFLPEESMNHKTRRASKSGYNALSPRVLFFSMASEGPDGSVSPRKMDPLERDPLDWRLATDPDESRNPHLASLSDIVQKLQQGLDDFDILIAQRTDSSVTSDSQYSFVGIYDRLKQFVMFASTLHKLFHEIESGRRNGRRITELEHRLEDVRLAIISLRGEVQPLECKLKEVAEILQNVNEHEHILEKVVADNAAMHGRFERCLAKFVDRLDRDGKWTSDWVSPRALIGEALSPMRRSRPSPSPTRGSDGFRSPRQGADRFLVAYRSVSSRMEMLERAVGDGAEGQVKLELRLSDLQGRCDREFLAWRSVVEELSKLIVSMEARVSKCKLSDMRFEELHAWVSEVRNEKLGLEVKLERRWTELAGNLRSEIRGMRKTTEEPIANSSLPPLAERRRLFQASTENLDESARQTLKNVLAHDQVDFAWSENDFVLKLKRHHIGIHENRFVDEAATSEVLSDIAAIMRVYSTIRVKIVGHSIALHGFLENWSPELALRRANIVKDKLVSKGISADRITTEAHPWAGGQPLGTCYGCGRIDHHFKDCPDDVQFVITKV